MNWPDRYSMRSSDDEGVNRTRTTVGERVSTAVMVASIEPASASGGMTARSSVGRAMHARK